jgi:hypothetical protein
MIEAARSLHASQMLEEQGGDPGIRASPADLLGCASRKPDRDRLRGRGR